MLVDLSLQNNILSTVIKLYHWSLPACYILARLSLILRLENCMAHQAILTSKNKIGCYGGREGFTDKLTYCARETIKIYLVR